MQIRSSLNFTVIVEMCAATSMGRLKKLLNKHEDNDVCSNVELNSRGVETEGWSGKGRSWEHAGAMTACTRGQRCGRWGEGGRIHRERKKEEK